MRKKKTPQNWLEDFKKVHGNTYEYPGILSNPLERGAKTKVPIICKKHGKFTQDCMGHSKGSGCPKCGRERSEAAKYVVDYKERFKEIHGDKYEYLDSDFSHAIKTRIKCKEHGVFMQTPRDHGLGRGCPKCGRIKSIKNNSVGREKIIERSIERHGDTYDYSKMVIHKVRDKGIITCKKHGDFEQIMISHIKGTGCPKCGMERSNQAKHDDYYSFVEKAKAIHGDNLDFSIFKYISSHTKGKVKCNKHDYIFDASPNFITQGGGCPKCGNSISKGESEIEDFLNESIVVKRRDRKFLDNNFEIDIISHKHKIGIEYNGLYWHGDNFKPDNYHLTKTEEVESRGYRLIHIFEDEWRDKKDIIKSRLNNIFRRTPIKIYARNTEIKKVSSKDSSEFLKKNHLQGNVNSKIRIGLYSNGELVSLMTFGKLRKNMGSSNKDNVYELYRFCNKLDTNVTGAASKLFKYFLTFYNPKEVISYADRRWSNGGLYEKLGFNLISKTKPNYFYTKGIVRENRFNYRKDILVSQGHDKNKTEREIMKEKGYYRIYDCGTLKYSYKIQ